MNQERLDQMKQNATDGKLFMNIKFTKNREINAYMYMGKGRKADKSIVDENK